MLRRKPTEVLWTSEQWLRLLSPQGDRYTSTHTRLGEHRGRGSEGVLGSAVLWTWHGRCAHDLTVAMVTCTRPSQKDQLTFQQAALIGLRGHEGECGGGGLGRGSRVDVIKTHKIDNE